MAKRELDVTVCIQCPAIEPDAFSQSIENERPLICGELGLLRHFLSSKRSPTHVSALLSSDIDIREFFEPLRYQNRLSALSKSGWTLKFPRVPEECFAVTTPPSRLDYL